MNVNKLKQWEIEKIQKIKSILVNLSINEKIYIYINVVKKKVSEYIKCIIYRFSQG